MIMIIFFFVVLWNVQQPDTSYIIFIRGIQNKKYITKKKISITNHFLINSIFLFLKKKLIVDLNTFYVSQKKFHFCRFCFPFRFLLFLLFVIHLFVVVHFQIEWFHLHRKDQRRLVIITRTHFKIAYSVGFDLNI